MFFTRLNSSNQVQLVLDPSCLAEPRKQCYSCLVQREYFGVLDRISGAIELLCPPAWFLLAVAEPRPKYGDIP